MDWVGIVQAAVGVTVGAVAVWAPTYLGKRRYRRRWRHDPIRLVARGLVELGLNHDQTVSVMRRYRDGR